MADDREQLLERIKKLEAQLDAYEFMFFKGKYRGWKFRLLNREQKARWVWLNAWINYRRSKIMYPLEPLMWYIEKDLVEVLRQSYLKAKYLATRK